MTTLHYCKYLSCNNVIDSSTALIVVASTECQWESITNSNNRNVCTHDSGNTSLTQQPLVFPSQFQNFPAIKVSLMSAVVLLPMISWRHIILNYIIYHILHISCSPDVGSNWIWSWPEMTLRHLQRGQLSNIAYLSVYLTLNKPSQVYCHMHTYRDVRIPWEYCLQHHHRYTDSVQHIKIKLYTNYIWIALQISKTNKTRH